MGGGGKSKKGGGGGGGAQQPQPQQRRAQGDADFESILAEVRKTTAQSMKLETTQWLSLLASAFAMTGLSQIFFHSPVFYDVDLPAYKGQFIGVTIASALALAYTYVAVASAREVKLLATREADAKGGKAAEEAMARSTSLEALSYALFAVNGLYLVMFLAAAFKICEAVGMQPVYTQLVSTLLPAVVLSARPSALA